MQLVKTEQAMNYFCFLSAFSIFLPSCSIRGVSRGLHHRLADTRTICVLIIWYVLMWYLIITLNRRGAVGKPLPLNLMSRFRIATFYFWFGANNLICLDLSSSLIKWRCYLPCLFQTRIHSEGKKHWSKSWLCHYMVIFLSISAKFLGLIIPVWQNDTKYTHITEFLLILNELMEVKMYRIRPHISEPLKRKFI